MMILIAAAILNFCSTIYCQKSASLTLGTTVSTYVENGQSLAMQCKLTSGTIDLSSTRSWLKDGVTLISDGILSPAGSGYSENVGTNEFSLNTPNMDFNFDGSNFRCVYKFSRADLNVLMFEFESTDQSDENCISGKSIDKCWFSLSKVFPGVSANLSVSYEDNTMDDINSMLNMTYTLNADGKTRAYYFEIESATFSKDVKEIKLTFITGPVSRTLTIRAKGVTTPLSTISSDMSTTVSSAGLSQEIVITITISSIIAAGVLIFLTVLVVNLCRQKNRQMPAKKTKETRFATKQGNFTKKDALKSSTEPKRKLSGKRNTKQESISLDKFEHTQFNNSQAPKDRMYDHYPQTTDYMYQNNSGNQHVLNHSHAERSIILYGNQYDRYPKSNSGPNNRMLYQSRYPEQPRQNEGMFQYYRADNLYRGQQMYHRPYVAQYDHHIKNKPENKRFEEKTYERNWDFLY